MKLLKRVSSLVLSAVLLITSAPTIVRASEKTEDVYPYMIYAGASYDESLLINAENLCMNGNLASAGTLDAYVEYNFNHNGSAYEDVTDGRRYLYNLIDREFFASSDVCEEDYEKVDNNINLNKSLTVKGDVKLDGNVSLNKSVKAYRDIDISGENLNANNICIEAKYGDITIDARNLSITGLIYAPFGNLSITAENLNLNNCIVIAESVKLNGKTVNINYNHNIAKLIGNTNELLDIPESEWQFMDDEDGDGYPDFLMDEDNWALMNDSDNDGLPDSIEDAIGTDKNLVDTDGDGLDDCYEVIRSFTDPLNVDSDDNGISDFLEDYDEDGLTIGEERKIGTDPIEADTDEDTILDGIEVKDNHTNPLKKDTDEDGLDDDDEIVCGTDPLNPDTNGNGVLDGDEYYLVDIEKELGTCEETEAVPSVTVSIEMKGNADKKVTIDNTYGVDILTSDIVGRVGAPIDLTATEDFDTATISFKYDREKLGDTSEDDLAIMWYDEENLEYVELTDAVLDKENQTISYVTTHFSTYVVINKKVWYDEWRKEIDYRSVGEALKYDISFVVDVSESMRGDNLARAKEALNAFLDTMYEGDKADLVEFNTAGTIVKPHGTSKEELKVAVENLEAGYDTSTNSGIEKGLEALIPYIQEDRKAIMILLCDGDVENNEKTKQLISEANNYNISIYTVNICNSDTEALSYISDSTGGHTYIANTPEEISDTLKTLNARTVSYVDLTDTDGDTIPDILETNGMRIQNGQIVYSDPNSVDSDGDGIPDGEELKVYLNSITVGSITTLVSVVVKGISSVFNSDSDGDGFSDKKDPNPYEYTYVPFLSKDYESNVKKTVLDKYNAVKNERAIYNHISQDQMNKVLAKMQIKIMMKDVIECEYTYLVSDEDWLRFCLFFNDQVKIYDCITEELHYFRNKLNRCPLSLDDMIDEINAASNIDDKWIMCSPNKGRFHMYGKDGSYNIKFISSNNTKNLYEAVYDKNGKLITENDDNGKNMGTYNYASSSSDAEYHIKVDVKTYETWGNTKADPKPVPGSWDRNVIIGILDEKEPYELKWGTLPNLDAREHYMDICEKIGIEYQDLLIADFSDICYRTEEMKELWKRRFGY